MSRITYRTGVALLTAAAFLLPLFAGITPVGASNVAGNDHQQQIIEDNMRPGAPFGFWEDRREPTVLYLRSSSAGPSTEIGNSGGQANGYPANPTMGVGGTAPGGDPTLLWLDTQRPQTGLLDLEPKSIQVGWLNNGATFNMHGFHPGDPKQRLGDFSNLTIYEVSAVFYADQRLIGTQGFEVEVHVQDADTGDRIDHNPASAAVTPLVTLDLGRSPGIFLEADEFRGSVILPGTDGYRMPDNHVLSFDVFAGMGAQQMSLRFDEDGADSRIILNSNSARLNIWSEDQDGRATQTFPTGAVAQTEDTRARLKLIHANLFGNEDCHTTTFQAPSVNEPSRLCPMDNIDQGQLRVRVRDLTTGQLVPLDPGQGLQCGDPGVDCFVQRAANSNFRLIKYENLDPSDPYAPGLFSFDFAYNASYPDGPYRAEFFDPVKGWTIHHNFHIGGVGFDFTFDPVEQVKGAVRCATDPDDPEECTTPFQLRELQHRIATGERTDYNLLLRNLGSTTDTFGISVPVPGAGWQATVHPSSVSLGPQEEAKVTVTVTPPSTAPAGDWRAITAQATSLRGGETQNIRLNTTLVEDRVFDHALFSPVVLVEAQAMVPKRFTASVVNLGTVQDTYVVVPRGVPDGWLVTTEPSYMTAYPKSSQDFVVTVIAPPEARGGDDWQLTLQAIRVADAQAIAERLIPVRVIERDGFSVMADHGLERQIRAPGLTNVDQRYDHSAVFRFTLENFGDRVDTFDVTASWLADASTDFLGCERGNWDPILDSYAWDGVPTGWRFRILETEHVTNPIMTNLYLGWDSGYPQHGGPDSPAPSYPDNGFIRVWDPAPGASYTAFSGNMPVANITVPARTTVEFFMEMAWTDYVDMAAPLGGVAADTVGRVDGVRTEALERDESGRSNCPIPPNGFLDFLVNPPRLLNPAPEANLRMEVRSQNDPTLVETKTLRAVHPYVGTSHAVRIETQLGQGTTTTFDPELRDGAVMNMRVLNVGNEADLLRVILTQEVPGWTHVFGDWQYIPSATSTAKGIASWFTQPNHGQSCEVRGPLGHELRCTGLGIYDEVHFEVFAFPPEGAEPGDRDLVKLGVVGGLQGPLSFSDSIRMETIVGADYIFDALELNQRMHVQPGESVAFPFSVHNVGLATDDYLLEVREAPAGWNSSFSSLPRVTVPAGLAHHGFLTVEVPENAPVGSTQSFKVRVTSAGTDNVARLFQTLEFDAVVVPPVAGLQVNAPAVTALQGQVTPFSVFAEGDEGNYQFTVDPNTMPRDWELVCRDGRPTGCTAAEPTAYRDRSVADGEGAVAEARFNVRVPVDELSTSRAAIRVAVCHVDNLLGDVCDPAMTRFAYAEINLASVYGVAMDTVPVRSVDGGNIQVVGRGQEAVHRVEIRNSGLSPQFVTLQPTAIPTGWSASIDTQVGLSFFVPPGGRVPAEFVMRAPDDAPLGAEAAVTLRAVVQQEENRMAQLTLVTRVGNFVPMINISDEVHYFAPEETVEVPIQVLNSGEVRDTYSLSASLPAGGAVSYREIGTLSWVGCPGTVDAAENRCDFMQSLEPGEFNSVHLEVDLGSIPDIPPGTRVPVTLTLRSLSAPADAPEVHVETVRLEVLRYVAQDVDGDGFFEYAVDRNRNQADGHEEFRESLVAGDAGVRTRVPDLVRFLSDEARERMTVQVTLPDGSTEPRLVYFLDANDDGRADFLLDSTGDGFPDIFWDPDIRHATRIDTVVDITGNGVPEYFIDIDGDQMGRLDVYFDLTEGRFCKLFPRHMDDAGTVGYVVDLGCTGRIDDGDPIVIPTPTGTVLTVKKLDMTNNDCLDEVYDTNGDGNPNHFIPHNKRADGSCEASDRRIPITLKDYNGDGVLDWGYDANGDGRVDSYYDPRTGRVHLVDERGVFFRSLQEFWYIGALFGLVLVLFLVLVAVTRRR